MVRHLFALSLMGILAVGSGCSMCSDCTDQAPNYQGGLYGHEDMSNGRINSAFTTTTTIVEEEIIEEGEQAVESAVYGAIHKSSADQAITSPVRQAALTKKDLQETSVEQTVKLITTEDLELTDADFGI